MNMKKLVAVVMLMVMVALGCFVGTGRAEAACSLLLAVSSADGEVEEISACQGASADGKVASSLEDGELTIKLSGYDGKMPTFVLRGSGVQYDRLILELEGENRVVGNVIMVDDADVSLIKPNEYVGSGSLKIYTSEEAKIAGTVVEEVSGGSEDELVLGNGVVDEDAIDNVEEIKDDTNCETEVGLTVFEVISIVYMVISVAVMTVLGVKCYRLAKAAKTKREEKETEEIN